MRVLFATDGSSDATTASEWVPHLPLPGGAELLVLTVIEPPVLPRLPGELHAERRAEAQRLVDETAARLGQGRQASGRVAEGDPREQIMAVARSWHAELIVLGARGVSGIQRFLLGSVSLGVAREASCSVLVCKGVPRAVRTITVGLDASSQARDALRWLGALPRPAGSRIRLVGVAEPQRYPSSAPSILGGTLRAAVAASEAEHLAALERTLMGAAKDLPSDGIEISALTGTPPDVLVREADRHESDLIVVGARGAGVVTRVLLGSVSEAVLAHASCPVAVVRARPPGD